MGFAAPTSEYMRHYRAQQEAIAAEAAGPSTVAGEVEVVGLESLAQLQREDLAVEHDMSAAARQAAHTTVEPSPYN